jgi:hypothetical protein
MNLRKKLFTYVIRQAIGILLFLTAHAYATAERGYEALGGELFLLGLPIFIWLFGHCVNDLRTELRAFNKTRKEMKL